MTDQTTLPQFFQKGVEHFSLALRLLAITFQHRFCYRGAGVNGIYIDAERAKCVRQRFGQGDAGDIARWGADRGAGHTSRAAAYVNDASPTSLLHVWRGVARAAIVTEKFFFEVFDDLLVGDYLHVVGDGAADTGGAVGEDVDSTQRLGSLQHESFD